jgi:cytoskeletal protein CcmA (bactofilin family)
MGKKNEDVKAFLGKGVVFDGKLILNGSVRIEGEFKGEITGDGTLTVGEDAKIEADITVNNIYIFGTVYGNLKIGETAEIGSTGKFTGTLTTSALIVQEGAAIEGDCKMVSRQANIEEKEEKYRAES